MNRKKRRGDLRCSKGETGQSGYVHGMIGCRNQYHRAARSSMAGHPGYVQGMISSRKQYGRAARLYPSPAVRYTIARKLNIPNHTARLTGGTNRARRTDPSVFSADRLSGFFL